MFSPRIKSSIKIKSGYLSSMRPHLPHKCFQAILPHMGSSSAVLELHVGVKVGDLLQGSWSTFTLVGWLSGWLCGCLNRWLVSHSPLCLVDFTAWVCRLGASAGKSAAKTFAASMSKASKKEGNREFLWPVKAPNSVRRILVPAPAGPTKYHTIWF